MHMPLHPDVARPANRHRPACRTQSGLPPLVLAASGGHMDVMTALLKAEAWTDEVDQVGWSVGWLACGSWRLFHGGTVAQRLRVAAVYWVCRRRRSARCRPGSFLKQPARLSSGWFATPGGVVAPS